MKIAITSGKGGTGKTTVSTGLFQLLSTQVKADVQLLDCDVEEPDCHIFLKATKTADYPVTLSIPAIDPGKCTFCGKCKAACAFNAIVMLPNVNFIEVNESLCHGCGACTYVCPEGAISEEKTEIGQVKYFDYHSGDDFIEGRLHIGKALQTPVIRETIRHAGNRNIILLDSPPGTSCPVVATVSKADFVVMVTEPTPFGLHDLKLMTETVKQLGKKHGIVVNKAGLDFPPLYDFMHENDIRVLGEIPFSKALAETYSKGEIIAEASEEVKTIFTEIISNIFDEAAV